MKKRLFLLFAVALGIGMPASAQLLALNITPGSGYSSVVTVTITNNGGCSTPPVLGTPVMTGSAPNMTLGSIPIAFAGTCTPGGASPTFSVTGGGGSGAAVTGTMIQASIALLTAQNGGYNYECTLVVPATLVYFYSAAYTGGNRLIQTSQASQLVWGAVVGASALQASYTVAYNAGTLTAFDGFVPGSLVVAESQAVTACAAAQTNLNAWNPWANYATYYNGTSWNAATIQ